MFAIVRALAVGSLIFVVIAWRHLSGLEEGSQSASLANLVWMVAPLCAGVACLLAGRVSRGPERRAWGYFAVGCFLCLAGMLTSAGYRHAGIEQPHPGAPDIGYLLGGLSFIPGMFLYLTGRSAHRWIEFWNFVLLVSGGALALFSLSLSNIATTDLSAAGIALSLGYPAIWLGAAGTGLVGLLIYVEPSRRLELLLMVASLSSQALNTFIYAQVMMEDPHHPGTRLDGSWIVAFTLFGWAAIERWLRPSAGTPIRAMPGHTDRHVAEAFYAGSIMAAVAVAVAIAGALRGEPVALLAIPVALVYALAIAAREYLGIATERGLRKSAEASLNQLRQSEQRLTSVLESTTDSVLVLDKDWMITFFNPRAQDVIGASKRLEVGRSLWEIFPEEVGGGFDRRYREALASKRPVAFEEYLPAGGMWLAIHAFPTASGLSIFFRDITAARLAREEITRLAFHDPLTGLGNRTLFKKSLDQCLSAGTGAAALMCLDLDHFKEVNDSFGHDIGDQLLKQVADRLVGVVNCPANVARLGGDEFAILLPDMTDQAALKVLADRIIASSARSYLVEGRSVTVGSSIGIALAPEHATSPEELFKSADAALYFAKSEGRGRALIFKPEMTEHVRWKQALRTDLTEALVRRQLHLVFQPIVNLATNKVSEFETLVRWQHPARGEVPPSVFIPVAEESGHVNEIGDWVLEASCLEAASWPAHLRLAVNLSACQFRDQELPERVSAILNSTGLDPRRLTLEVTESALLEDWEEARRMLVALRAVGVRISLDDFGTGYSSLSYLRMFPLDDIKLDRSFVAEHENPTSKAIIGAVVDIAKTLGSSTVAEGVETRQQLDVIRQQGCTHAQGYFFSRPVPSGQVLPAIRHIEESAIWWTEQNRRA